MSRNIMSIGRIMYSKMPTKRKLSDFYGFGLPSIMEMGKWTNIYDSENKLTPGAGLPPSRGNIHVYYHNILLL